MSIKSNTVSAGSGRCTICYTRPLLTFAHISSFAHRHNVQSLPPEFWLMTDDEIHSHLHANKKIESKKKSRKITF